MGRRAWLSVLAVALLAAGQTAEAFVAPCAISLRAPSRRLVSDRRACPPPTLPRAPDWRADTLVGATGGLTGALAAFPGAMIAIWCALKPWAKERQRAVLQAYILVMQIAALGVIAALSEATGKAVAPDPAAFCYLLPAALGTFCGLEVFRFMTQRQFGRSVNLLLVLSGLAMLLT